LDRASGYEPEGREFESLRAHHFRGIPFASHPYMKISPQKLAWTQRGAALAIIAFWISFWANHTDLPQNVVDFEWCFLLPDILWISGAFALASHWLITRDPRAGIATAVAGSSLAYLGLLDAACNFRHGQYTGSFSRGALNAVINIACLLFGCANIWYAAKRI
jgi:hypothetical protein